MPESSFQELSPGEGGTPLHIKILKAELRRRQDSNKQYSLRAFARDLAFQHGHLCEILKCKKSLTEEAANRICDKLDITENDRAAFCAAAAGAATRVVLSDTLARRFGSFMKQDAEPEAVFGAASDLLSQWQYSAIYALISVSPKSFAALAASTGLPLEDVETKAEELRDLGLARISGQTVYAEKSQLVSRSRRDGARTLHHDALDLARGKLGGPESKGQMFSTSIMALDEDQVSHVREAIQAFWKTLIQISNQTKTGECVSLISLQYFAISPRTDDSPGVDSSH